MKLLVCTQKVDKNDDVLGFFHGWIKEFSLNCEQVTVICLEKGEHDLPGNVKVFSLGKEDGAGRLKYMGRFFSYIKKFNDDYNAVFVHMNPEYAILGATYWHFKGKRIGLWYTHKSTNMFVRIAAKFVDIIFTASKDSFRVKSKKVKVMGHGIETDRFIGIERTPRVSALRILSIGRISRSKDYETLLKAAKILKEKNFDFKVTIVGGPILENEAAYSEELKLTVKDFGLESVVEFTGSVPNTKIHEYLKNADVFVHMSRTGSLDKVALEAMAAGLPVISSNDAIVNDVLKDYPELHFKPGDETGLSERLMAIGEWAKGEDLKRIVIRDHGLKSLIDLILKKLYGETG